MTWILGAPQTAQNQTPSNTIKRSRQCILATQSAVIPQRGANQSEYDVSLTALDQTRSSTTHRFNNPYWQRTFVHRSLRASLDLPRTHILLSSAPTIMAGARNYDFLVSLLLSSLSSASSTSFPRPTCPHIFDSPNLALRKPTKLTSPSPIHRSNSS